MLLRLKSTSIPFIRLWLAVLCGYLALGVTLQYLPTYMNTQLHCDPFIIGSVISIASLAAAFTRPIAGRIADLGFPRTVVLAGSILGVLGGLGHWYAPNLLVLFISRLLLGAGEGALFTGAVSMVIYNCAPEKRGVFAGWFGLSMWGGLCGGPILASWFHTIFSTSISVWSLVTILPIMGGMFVVSTFGYQYKKSDRNHLATNLLPHQARLPGLAFLLSSYGYGSINAMLILYFQYHHLLGINIALAIFAGFFLVTRLAASPLVGMFGGRLVLLTFISIEIAGLIIISSGIYPAVLAGVALTGIGVSMLYPAFVAIVVQQAPVNEQGTAIGFMTSFWDVGIVIAGPIGGFIAVNAGYKMVFLIAAIVAAVALMIILRPLKLESKLLTTAQE